MRKIFTFILIMTITSASFAQMKTLSDNAPHKKFKVDVSLGYAKPQNSFLNTGFLFVVEPKYAVVENISVGLRMEAAVTASVKSNDNISATGTSSYLATGDYYFKNDKFRPFAGVGAGIFRSVVVDQDIIDSGVKIPVSSNFGGMVRGGFEYGHFRMGIEYNLVAKKAGYLGIKLGFCIGGGRE